MKEKKTTEMLKHVFTEKEMRELSADLAEQVNALARAEAEKKAVASQIKSDIDGIQAKVNNLASKISSGYEFKQTDCSVIADYPQKVWVTIRDDTGELVKEQPMTPQDLEGHLFEESEGGSNHVED